VFGTLATAGVVALFALAVTAAVAPDALARLRSAMAGTGTALGGAVAVVAMGGSLWFSEGAHFPPCDLCWYQRIAMYPLAIVLPMAAVRGDRSIRPYTFALAGLGTAVSLWHNAIETFPSLEGASSCDPSNPCTLRWVEGLGFWTIPRLALLAFVLVIVALALDGPDRPEADEPDDLDEPSDRPLREHR
jgi:disulfide bond formation protein DsbB